MPEPGGSHIALVAASMRMGGAERMTLNLAAEFARRGHRVDLVLIDRTGPLLDRVPPAVRVVGLGGARARQVIGALRSYLKRERPAALLSVAFQTNILTMVASLGLRRRPRIILSVRNSYSATLAAGSRMTRNLLGLATRWLYPRADKVVGISHGCSDDVRRKAGLPADRMATIYNPVLDVDFERRAAAPARPADRGDGERALIVTVGRLAPQKDHATLLRAFARLVRHQPARLLLIGEGDLRDDLEALARALGVADHVVFAGLRDNPYPAMREADLFVLSSAWEGFGNVLVEAMAVGTPVVATDCPDGPAEILEGGKWGRLVPPGDADALAAAMLDVLRGGGIDARERARLFTVGRAADQYLDLLLDLHPAGPS